MTRASSCGSAAHPRGRSVAAARSGGWSASSRGPDVPAAARTGHGRCGSRTRPCRAPAPCGRDDRDQEPSSRRPVPAPNRSVTGRRTSAATSACSDRSGHTSSAGLLGAVGQRCWARAVVGVVGAAVEQQVRDVGGPGGSRSTPRPRSAHPGRQPDRVGNAPQQAGQPAPSSGPRGGPRRRGRGARQHQGVGSPTSRCSRCQKRGAGAPHSRTQRRQSRHAGAGARRHGAVGITDQDARRSHRGRRRAGRLEMMRRGVVSTIVIVGKGAGGCWEQSGRWRST